MNPRRIMEHIRKLGWPAIGIELVIVIVGVFIGMQVSKSRDPVQAESATPRDL
jgi:uncharacterized membrane protein YdfJ with MMPL/SSD domain